MRNTAGSMLDDAADDFAARRATRGLNGTGVRDARSLWLILRWRASLIATLVLTTVAMAAGVLAILPPKYKATTVVLVDPRQPRVTAAEAVLVRHRRRRRRGREPGRTDPVLGAGEARDRQACSRPGSGVRVAVAAGCRCAAPWRACSAARRTIDEARGSIGWSTASRPGFRCSGAASPTSWKSATRRPIRRRRSASRAPSPTPISRISARGAATSRRDASGWLGGRIDELRQRLERSERAVADYKSPTAS